MTRRIMTAAACVAAAGLLAACGGSGGDSGSGGGDGGGGSTAHPSARSAAAAPIIPLAQARTVLSHYETVNNRANKEQDGKLLSTVEDAALFQQSSAGFKQFPYFSAKDKTEYRSPFHHVDPQFSIPATGDWFMASSGITGAGFGKDAHELMVFKKVSGAWKMVASAAYTGTLPALSRGAGGAAVVVAPDATVGTTKLSGLGGAVNDLRVSGGKKAGAEFADSPVRKAVVKDYTDRNADWGAYKTCLRTDFEDAGPKYDSSYTRYPDAFALRTADGGALVVFTSYFVKLEFSTRPEMCSVVPGGEMKAYIPAKTMGIRARYSTRNLVSVPAAGKPVQLGSGADLLGATT